MGDMANDVVVKRLQKRIADWTQIPESHGEVLLPLLLFIFFPKSNDDI